MIETLYNRPSSLELHSIKVNKDRTGVFKLKKGATLPFQMIKISCINTAYTMSCDLREKWSHRQGRTCHRRTKSTQLYIFCFLLVSVHTNTISLFLICPKPFSPLLDHFWVLICIENHFAEYGIFLMFKFLRFTYTI